MLRLVLAVVLAGSSGLGTAHIPRRGVLVPGESLAGVRLGDTAASVEARLGTRFRVCRSCSERTWYYAQPAGEPLGLGVSFRRGLVGAVFTLGAPAGWRTSEGLALGDAVARVHELYGAVSWRECVGYVALTMRRGGVVTSIYTTGESVYGFALTRTGETVCR